MTAWTAWRLGLAGLAATLIAGLASAQSVTLTPEEMRQATSRAIGAGRPDMAMPMADALLGRDAEDAEAHILRSQALRDLGRAPQATIAARQGWRHAETDEIQFGAALAMAQALATDGKRTRAQWWLRRAAELAPDERMRALVERDFRYVRLRNPWSTSLRFNIAPSSNVNGGSTEDTTRLFDLPLEFELSGESQALSGTELSFGISTSYRLRESASGEDRLRLEAGYRTYVLSGDAQDKAPEASGSDYAFGYLALGYSLERQAGWAGAPYRLDATIGTTRYGGDALMDFLRLGAVQDFALSDDMAARLSLSREWQAGANGRDDVQLWDLRGDMTWRVGAGGRLSLGLSRLASASDDSGLDYTRTGIALGFDPAGTVAGLDLSFGLGLSRRDQPVSRYSRDGRQDDKLSLSVTAAFDRVDYYGFVPTATLRAERTDSNLGLYDSEEIGIELGIRSAF